MYLDFLTRVVGPGEELPIVVNVVNKGQKGTDIKVRLEVTCYNQKYNISDEFLVYVGPDEQIQQPVGLTVCSLSNETGSHRLFSYVLWGKDIMAEVKSYFFINKTYFRLIFEDIPEIFGIEQGKSKLFDIYIKNPSNITIHNLRLLIEKIPYEWIKVEPLKITEIQPGKSGIFFCKFNNSPRYRGGRISNHNISRIR